jgi:hypothetical protein
MGWTIGNNAIAPLGQYNFTLYWTKRGATPERCELSSGNNIMAIGGLGSFRRIKQ